MIMDVMHNCARQLLYNYCARLKVRTQSLGRSQMYIDDQNSFGELLARFRTRERLSQQRLASILGVHRNTVVNWEQSNYLPKDRTTVLELSRVLSLAKEDE